MNATPPALMDVLVEDCVERENDIPWLYLDTRGLVTTGVGHMLHGAPEASRLPFNLGDRPATVGEITSDFVRVLSMPPAHVAAFYRSPRSVTLPVGYGRTLCQQELAGTYLPGIAKLVPDLYSHPAGAIRALVAISYTCGLGGLATFTHTLAAINARDYRTAAAQAHVKTATPETNAKLEHWLLDAAGRSTS